MNIIRIFIFLGLTGCSDDVCEDVQKELCHHCGVSDTTKNTVCACIEDGEVKKPLDYFGSKKEAEVYCYNLKNTLKEEYSSPAELAECAGDLLILEEYKADACELHGLESATGPTLSSDGACQELADCYGVSSDYFEDYGEEYCEEMLEYEC